MTQSKQRTKQHTKNSNLDTIKKKSKTTIKTKKLNIKELLDDKPDTIYIDRSKNLKLLKVYDNYLIKYNNKTYFCNIKSIYIPKIKLELEEAYKLIKKYDLVNDLNVYDSMNSGKADKDKGNNKSVITIKLFLKTFDKSILNEYMDKNNKELETIKTLIKNNPSLLTKCKLIEHDNKTVECVTIALTIKNNNFYTFYIKSLLHNDYIDKICNNMPGSVWLYIIDYYINNYTNTTHKNKVCTLYDGANKRTFEFCPGLNKLYTDDKIKQNEFINILLNPPNEYNKWFLDLYNLSIRMIFDTGVKFYEKYGYITYNDMYDKDATYDKDIFNYINYYNCLSNFIDDIANRKILIYLPLNKIISIAQFLYELKKLNYKTFKYVTFKKDNLDKQNTNSSVNTTKSKAEETISNKKDNFYKSLNDNEKTIFNIIDGMIVDSMYLKDIYNKYYKLNGYIEYLKLINKPFMDEYLKINTLITIHDMYKFTLYLLDNLNKLFNNYKTITYNDYYKYANIIAEFTSAVANSLYINKNDDYKPFIKYYNTCKYFIDIGNNKYENFDKHVAMIHQKIKGVHADYIKPIHFTTPPVNVIQEMIKKKEVVIFTPNEAYNKLLYLNNKLLDYYKLY